MSTPFSVVKTSKTKKPKISGGEKPAERIVVDNINACIKEFKPTTASGSGVGGSVFLCQRTNLVIEDAFVWRKFSVGIAEDKIGEMTTYGAFNCFRDALDALLMLYIQKTGQATPHRFTPLEVDAFGANIAAQLSVENSTDIDTCRSLWDWCLNHIKELPVGSKTNPPPTTMKRPLVNVNDFIYAKRVRAEEMKQKRKVVTKAPVCCACARTLLKEDTAQVIVPGKKTKEEVKKHVAEMVKITRGRTRSPVSKKAASPGDTMDVDSDSVKKPRRASKSPRKRKQEREGEEEEEEEEHNVFP